MTKPIIVSMSRFADFCVSDPASQLSKVREIRRQYEQPYKPKADFWSRWCEGTVGIHRRGGSRDDLALLGTEAQDNRGEQYSSASAGYAKFWGRKKVEFAGTPKPALWTYDRLTVRVNPEWMLQVNGVLTVVKLHLKERLPLNQRLANPLLHLLDSYFRADDREVMLLDVHRGKPWRPTAESRSMDAVLRMQAAAFLVGWDERDRQEGAA